MKAIDTIADITPETVLALKQKGVGAVFGYLGLWSKCLTPERTKVLRSAQMSIGFLYEADGKTFNAELGTYHAKDALVHAKILGIPKSVGIAPCVDYDAPTSDYPAVRAYLRAWRAVMNGHYRTGLYAPAHVLVVMKGEYDYDIEPAAWSHGQKVPGIAAYQNSPSTTLCGIAVDLDDVYDTSILWGSDSMKYPKVQAMVDGKTVLAVAVGNVTYLNWTVARDSGCNITKAAPGDVEINGHKPLQVYDGVTTYIKWSAIPSLDPNPQKANGVWQFSTRKAYNLVVQEQATAEVGMWATIKIQTLENGQPFGHQIITIAENGVQQVEDYTDANGQYPWQLNEVSAQTDTITVSWKDPDGQTHSVTRTTTFTVPKAEPTPVPSDDKVVAQFAILPSSDASDAVYFDMTAPDGTVIQCQLDTGAFELMFTADAAKTLALKDEKDITIGGVGGTTPAYDSHASFSINGVLFKDVPCTVAPDFKSYPLFGYKFFVDNNYDLLVSHVHHTVTILKSAA